MALYSMWNKSNGLIYFLILIEGHTHVEIYSENSWEIFINYTTIGRDAGKSIIAGANIHIFMFIDHKKQLISKQISENTNIWISAPVIINFPASPTIGHRDGIEPIYTADLIVYACSQKFNDAGITCKMGSRLLVVHYDQWCDIQDACIYFILNNFLVYCKSYI